MAGWEKIPVELRERRQWVCWALEMRGEQPTKVPRTIGGYDASVTRSRDWYTFDDVIEAAPGVAGIGFVFTADDPLLGIDLDRCLLDGGEIAPWADPILERFRGTYAEVSPSGTGVKIFCRATNRLPSGRAVSIGDGGRIELYDRGRFFTVTGRAWDDAPITDAQDAVDWLLAEYFPDRPERSAPAVDLPQSDIVTRARAYLTTVDPAISGQRGHDTCFRAACKLVHGFSLDPDTAYGLLATEYNPRCVPPWSEKELRHKVDSAAATEAPRGYLLTERPTEAAYPEVDLSGLTGAVETPGPERTDPADPKCEPTGEPFPAELIPTDGLLGDIVRWSLDTALYPEPVLAFSGALALMAALLGRKVQDVLGTRTNLYIVAIARTGTGKEHPRKTNTRLLTAAKLQELLGPDAIASEAGLLRSLKNQPCSLYQLDEIGRILATMGDPRRSPHLYGIGRALLTLWSSADSVLKGAAYSDGRDTSIEQPHCVIYGSTTPTDFYSSLSGEDIRNGLMNRMIVLEPIEQYPDENRSPLPPVPPADLVDRISAWGKFAPGGNTGKMPDYPQPITVEADADAAERLADHRRSIRNRQRREEEDRAAIWSRTNEKAGKLALLHACSRFTGDPYQSAPRITLRDVEWGIAIANHLTRQMARMVDEHVADSTNEANIKRLLQIIRSKGERAAHCIRIKRSDLLRSMQRVKKRELDELLTGMAESEQVFFETAETGGRGRPANYVCIPP